MNQVNSKVATFDNSNGLRTALTFYQKALLLLPASFTELHQTQFSHFFLSDNASAASECL